MQSNKYVLKNMKTSMSYVELTQDLIAKLGSKIKNGKALLSLLREYSVYIGPNLELNENLCQVLLATASDTSTIDVDRKLVRTSYFVLMEMIFNSPSNKLRDKISSELIRQLQIETKQGNGSRLCMAWRLLARLAFFCQSEEVIEFTLKSNIKSLQYPQPVKNSMFGQKKAIEAYENQIHYWNTLFSSLRRIKRAPTADCVQSILSGCRSSHVQLARHSFYLLSKAIFQYPYEVGPYFRSSLSDGGFLSRASTDVMSCVYLIETCKVFITSTAANTDPGVSKKGPIEDTLVVVFKMLEDQRLKVRVECVRILTEIPRAKVIDEACASLTGGASMILKLSDSILPHLKKLQVPPSEEALSQAVNANIDSKLSSTSPIVIGTGEVILGPLCRACVRLGRYIVQRPPDSASSNTNIAAEEVSVEGLVRPLGKELGRLSRGFAASSCYMPHAWSEVLKALLWIMPENRARLKEHSGLWAWLLGQVFQAIPRLGEDLTEHLVMHILGRIHGSPFYCSELLEMALMCAEEAVEIFVNGGGHSVGVLIQVWTKFSEYGKHEYARHLLLNSLLRAISRTTVSNETQRKSAVPGIGLQSSSQSHAQSSTASPVFHLPQVSRQQELLSLRHFALWALGEHFELWDMPDIPDGSETFRISMFDATPIPPLLKPADIFSPTFGSADIFTSSAATTWNTNNSTASSTQELMDVPPLVKVISILLNCLWIEPSHTHSVCLESLFKICVALPRSHPLAILIQEQIHHTAASGFSLNYPYMQSTMSVWECCDEISPHAYDLSGTWFGIDNRNTIKRCDMLGFENPIQNMYDNALQHHQRVMLDDNCTSASHRDAALYLLALDSAAIDNSVFQQETAIPDAGHLDTSTSLWPPPLEQPKRNASINLIGDLLSYDLMVAPITAPSSSHSSVAPKFVVKDEELQLLMHQLLVDPYVPK